MVDQSSPGSLFQSALSGLDDDTYRRQSVQVSGSDAALTGRQNILTYAAAEINRLYWGLALHEEQTFLVDADFCENSIGTAGIFILEVADFFPDGRLNVSFVLV